MSPGEIEVMADREITRHQLPNCPIEAQPVGLRSPFCTAPLAHELVTRLAAQKERAERPDYEQMRRDRGWPTPNHMRRIADAIDQFTPAKYGDVLRWVADLCDEALTPAAPTLEEK